MQTTSKVFMVKPVRFGYNPQTAGNNAFSRPGRENSAQENALREFTSYVALLRANKIDVVIGEDTSTPHTPDSIFPNNWFSTHEDGTMVLYPMSTLNRRHERKEELLEVIRKNFEVRRLIDLTWWENDNLYLEGTGSMVLDRENKIVYAAKSQRTSEKVLEDFCKQMCYTPVYFEAYDRQGVAIYHTNVMMSVGTAYAIVCMESIRPEDRDRVRTSIMDSGKKILDISFGQLGHFAGNMLELHNTEGRPILVMSASPPSWTISRLTEEARPAACWPSSSDELYNLNFRFTHQHRDIGDYLAGIDIYRYRESCELRCHRHIYGSTCGLSLVGHFHKIVIYSSAAKYRKQIYYLVQHLLIRLGYRLRSIGAIVYIHQIAHLIVIWHRRYGQRPIFDILLHRQLENDILRCDRKSLGLRIIHIRQDITGSISAEYVPSPCLRTYFSRNSSYDRLRFAACSWKYSMS